MNIVNAFYSVKKKAWEALFSIAKVKIILSFD